MTLPLRSARILSGIPRRVLQAPSYGAFKSLTPRDEKDFVRLVHLIRTGREVPDEFYSATAGHPDRDPLLRDYGVMHLHLGGRGSDTLLFLMQFADKVVLLETNTHRRFRRQSAELIRHHRLMPAAKPAVEVRKSRSAKRNGSLRKS